MITKPLVKILPKADMDTSSKILPIHYGKLVAKCT